MEKYVYVEMISQTEPKITVHGGSVDKWRNYVRKHCCKTSACTHARQGEQLSSSGSLVGLLEQGRGAPAALPHPLHRLQLDFLFQTAVSEHFSWKNWKKIIKTKMYRQSFLLNYRICTWSVRKAHFKGHCIKGGAFCLIVHSSYQKFVLKDIE